MNTPTQPGAIVDLFAGPGGWSEGLRMLGLSDIGIEWDRDACSTRKAAGHLTVRADVAQYPPEPFAGAWGLIASPPCPDFSSAGKRRGIDGDSGHLIFQVPRWVDAVRPEWIACEQVPEALSWWKAFGRQFEELGYSCWSGVLTAADYGVPQTRDRAVLIAHRSRPALPPHPTHAEHPAPGLFCDQDAWVTWGDALAVGADFEAVGRRGAGMIERHGERPSTPSTEPFPTVTGGSHRRHWLIDRRTNSRGPRGTIVPTVAVPSSKPAPTVLTGSVSQWVLEDMGGGKHRLTPSGALVLQSFAPDYPVQGSSLESRQRQIGNAVPPLMAAHLLSSVTGVPVPALERVS